MPILLKNLTFPPKLTAQNPQNAPSRAKNMGRLKIPVFLTPDRDCTSHTMCSVDTVERCPLPIVVAEESSRSAQLLEDLTGIRRAVCTAACMTL